MKDFEQLGMFYLGKPYDTQKRQTVDEPLLYDAKDLTTHAVCVGMTGSGKTGLGIALIEEAAIDGVPAIVIGPAVWIMVGSLAPVRQTLFHGTRPPMMVLPRMDGRP